MPPRVRLHVVDRLVERSPERLDRPRDDRRVYSAREANARVNASRTVPPLASCTAWATTSSWAASPRSRTGCRPRTHPVHHGIHAACVQLVDRPGLDRDEPLPPRTSPLCCSRNLNESVDLPDERRTATFRPFQLFHRAVERVRVTQARLGSCDERSRPATICTSTPSPQRPAHCRHGSSPTSYWPWASPW